MPKEPLGTLPVAPMHLPHWHARAASSASTRWPTRRPPWHTRVTALLAPGTGGHGPGVCSTPGLSPQAGVGMDGDRGTCAALPALWHPLPHAGTSQPGPPTTWVGVTRTRCPCTPAWPGRLGQGPGAGWGGGAGAVGTPDPAPHSQCQHPHSALSLAAYAKGKGWGAGSHSPQDGWVKLNPIWFHYWLQSLESWLLSSSARKGQGGGTESPEHPAAPRRRPSIPLFPPITHITGQHAEGCTSSLSPACEDGAS